MTFNQVLQLRFRMYLGPMVMNGVLHIPQSRNTVGLFYSPSLLGSRWGSLTPFQRCSRCILQPQSTGPSLRQSYPFSEMQSVYSTAPVDWALVGAVLPLFRDAVGVFYSLSRLGPRWGSLTPFQICSRCILQPQSTGPSLGQSYPFSEMQSVYSTAPVDWALVEAVLPLFRDAVGVFYSPSRLGSRWGSLTPFQRCSRCILQPQPTGPSLRQSYPFSEMQSVYSTAPVDWALVEAVLPLFRDAVGVFYSPSRLGPR